MISNTKEIYSPKISVLIPVYNRVDMLREAVESVLAQSYNNFEIIISDNSSSDGTLEVAQGFARTDSRIKVYKNQVNLGPVANWQACLANATGDLVHWLWSDDWIEPDFYADAIQKMEATGATLLTTWNYRSDSSEVNSGRYVSWCFEFDTLPGILAAQKILAVTNELPLSPAAWILPIDSVREGFFSSIESTGPYDPVPKGVGVDSLMIIHSALKANKVAVLKTPSVTFRSHDNISNALGSTGELSILYTLAHVWYLRKFQPELTFIQALRILLRAIKGCWRCNRGALLVIRQVLIGLQQAKISKVGLIDPYKSKKARFRS